MSRHFVELQYAEDPDVRTLAGFVHELESFFDDILFDNAFMERVCRNDIRIVKKARASYKSDVKPALGKMHAQLVETADSLDRIPNPSDTPLYGQLVQHGLVGVSAAFKYSVLSKLCRAWRTRDGQHTVGAGFKAVIDAIDAILDSLVQVTPVGGVVKEFKDALAAIAPVRAGG